MASGKQVPYLEPSIWIGCPPEDIWDYLVDVSNETLWRGSVLEAGWVSDPPYMVGSKGLHLIDNVGEWPWMVTELEEPRLMSWVVTGNRFEGAHAGYRIVPEDTGSRVTIYMGLKPKGLMRIILPIMKGRMRSQFTADLVQLKAIMEA